MSGPSRASLLALLVTVFLDLLGFGMILPVLALYAEKFGVSDVAVTALMATYSFMQLFFAPIWGRVSDRYGRRSVLLVSIAGSCLSQLGYAFAGSFPGLVAARAVAGLCGANISAAQAYIADSTDEESRTAGMGLLGAALGLGFVLGPAFGGWAGKDDPTLPFRIASALSAGNFLLAAFTLREPRPAAERVASRSVSWRVLYETVTAPRLGVLIAVYFIVTFGFAQLEGTYPLYLERRFHFGRREVGTVFSSMGVVLIVTQGFLVRRLQPRLGEKLMVVAGTALMALGLLVTTAANNLPLLGLSLLLVSLGNGINTPALSSLISRAAGGDRQGGVLGVSQSFGALARVGGPLCGGMLLGYGEGVPYVAAALILTCASVLCLIAVAPPATAART